MDDRWPFMLSCTYRKINNLTLSVYSKAVDSPKWPNLIIPIALCFIILLILLL